MSLSVVSFSYKTTPLALREKLAVPAAQIADTLRDVKERCTLREVMLVSTCNRVEFYFLGEEGDGGARNLLDWMKRGFAGWDEELERGAVVLQGEAALTHLFRVACSLESMVLGEPQILGQVKEGYQAASESRSLGPYLTGLMQRVFHAAKRVRTETDIARFPVSVSFVAAELAGRIFDTLEDKTVLVIGAGEMAELVVTHLQAAGARKLLITNRTFATGVALAEKFHGSAVRFENLEAHLAEADIVISSTGAPGYVVTADSVRVAERTRKGRPMFVIDIAVPRDVDPEVNDLADVYCYDVDDLQAVADANQSNREKEALQAQRIVEEEVTEFVRWKRSDSIKPVIKALRQRFAETGEAELDKLLGRLKHLDPQDAAALRGLVRALVNKLLHAPSTRLKELGADRNGQFYAEAVTELFGLLPQSGTTGAAQAEEAPAERADEPGAENVVAFPQTGRSQG